MQKRRRTLYLPGLRRFMLFFYMYLGAESRNRTGTLFPARDFESRASTYSAISATRPLL